MTEYEYALQLDDGRIVGIGSTTRRASVVDDWWAWTRDGFPGRIVRRPISPWEDDPDGRPPT